MIKEWEFQKISVVLYPFPHIYDLDAIGEKKSGVAAFARENKINNNFFYQYKDNSTSDPSNEPIYLLSTYYHKQLGIPCEYFWYHNHLKNPD